MQYLYETAIEFAKLEKVEIGGLKGKMLSANVFQIFEEFNECFKIFTENTYDNLDYQLQEFHDDYERFETRVNELDRRLGDIVCQAFDDCVNIESMFKVLSYDNELDTYPSLQEALRGNCPFCFN